LHRLGELAFVAAVRDALPRSFIALAAAVAVIFGLDLRSPAAPHGSIAFALSAALLPGFGVMAVALVLLLAFNLSQRTGYARLAVVAAAAVSFALLLPRPFGPDPIAYLRTLGTTGLFLAMLACGVAGLWMAGARRVMGRTAAADWVGGLLAVAAVAVPWLLGVSIAASIAAGMQPIAHLGDSYFALMVIVLVETLLWSAGVHGPAVLAAFLTPVYLTMQMQNTHAFGAHAPLPYIVVVSIFLFVFPGGAGATLSLAGLLAFSRVPRLRRLGRVTLVPALFNVNDPLLFGTPVVFNPYLVVPFVGTPLILASITYACVAVGLVARAAFYVPSFVPSVIATYAATQDLRAIPLTLFNIGLAALIYYPFVRAYERHLLRSA